MANLNRERKREAVAGDREFAKKYLKRYVPSVKRPKAKTVVPDGLVPVFIVRTWNGKVSQKLGAYFNEDKAWAKADEAYISSGGYHKQAITVDRKGGIKINGKWYVVNVLPIRFDEEELSNDQEAQLAVHGGPEQSALQHEDEAAGDAPIRGSSATARLLARGPGDERPVQEWRPGPADTLQGTGEGPVDQWGQAERHGSDATTRGARPAPSNRSRREQ